VAVSEAAGTAAPDRRVGRKVMDNLDLADRAGRMVTVGRGMVPDRKVGLVHRVALGRKAALMARRRERRGMVGEAIRGN